MTYTVYELARAGLEPILPPIYRQIRSLLLRQIKSNGSRPLLLDVGGRKSPYTIGVPAAITVIDLPRESEVQKQLHLGITDDIVAQLKRRRSNIEEFIFGDMTCSGLPSNTFDFVVSVEVLEHVEEDEKFVREVSRVLKPGGKFFMTTPNGDFVENKNPDHKRHYKKSELEALLATSFGDVRVEYAIAGGQYRRMGLKPWSIYRPVQTALSVTGNVINGFQSGARGIADRSKGTHHLFAVAQKGSEPSSES